MSGNKTDWNKYWFRDFGKGIQDYGDFSTVSSVDVYYNSDKDILVTPAEVKKSYATLSFIISAAIVLPALTLLGRAVHKINQNQVKAFSHHLAYYSWLFVACLLACILNILNLFDNFLNSDEQTKSGKSCYYIYVMYGTFITFVGFCILCLALDVAYTVISSTQHLVEISSRKIQVHFLCFFLSVVCFFINNIPHMFQRVNFRSLNKCWKGNAYEGHAQLAALIDLGLLGVVILMITITFLLTTFVIKCKTRNNDLLMVPEYMRVFDVDSDIVVEDVPNVEEEGSQVRVSEETPSSEPHAKADCKKLEEEKQQMKKTSNSRKRIISWKQEKESSSKESSCHENSGYISDGNEKEGHAQKRQSLAFNSTRRRSKSDSEMQEPRLQAYRVKQTPRRVIEEQVFEALENFFVTDPSKMLSKALGSQRNCELSEHLIDSDSVDKGQEEETSFNSKEAKSKEVKKKNRKLAVKDICSLQRASSCKDGKKRHQLSTSSYKEKSDKVKCQSRDCVNFSSEKNLKSFSIMEKYGQFSVSSWQEEVETPKKNLIDLNEQTDVINSPRIVIEDVDGDTAPSARQHEGTNKLGKSCLSVNADVHCSDLRRCISSVDAIETDIEFHFKDNQNAGINSASNQEQNLGNSIENMPETAQGVGLGGKVKLEDQADIENVCCLAEVETETENIGTVDFEELDTDAVFYDIENDSQPEVDPDGEIKCEKENERQFKNGIRRGDNDASNSEIEIESSIEKRKGEMLLFKDYCKKYLLQPFKSVASLMLAYVVCLLPQIVLDIYRIVLGRPETIQDKTDGIISICSDAAMSIFLLAITVTFQWQNRKCRNVK